MTITTAYLVGRTLWSFRKEMMALVTVLVILISLPIVAVVAVASSGVQQVSDTLAKFIPETRLVRLFDPKGNLFKEYTPEVRWPADGLVTAEYGVPHEPWEKYHTGIDIASKDGKNGLPVYPMISGKVIGIYDQTIGFGKHVVLDHGDSITTTYGHLQEVKVNEGDDVGLDREIGLMDSTGYSTGSHVHLMVKVFGIPVNPRVFLDAVQVSD